MNIIMMYASIVYNVFDMSKLNTLDIVGITTIFLWMVIYGTLFAFTNKNLEEILVTLVQGMFEYKQYQDMFNSL